MIPKKTNLLAVKEEEKGKKSQIEESPIKEAIIKSLIIPNKKEDKERDASARNSREIIKSEFKEKEKEKDKCDNEKSNEVIEEIKSMKYNDGLDTYKKFFFVSSNELQEEGDHTSMKFKRDVIVNKLMYDQTFVKHKPQRKTFSDNIEAYIFLELSKESRNLLLQEMHSKKDSTFFQYVLGLRKDRENSLVNNLYPGKVTNNIPITNELILNLCNNFIRSEDLSISKESTHVLFAEPQKEENKNPSIGNDVAKALVNDAVPKSSFSQQKLEVQNAAARIAIEKPNMAVEEIDEELDKEVFNFFLDFVKNNPNHPSREKVENIINVVKGTSTSVSGKLIWTNKMKNELLRNLKTEYLKELEEVKRENEELLKQRDAKTKALEMNKKQVIIIPPHQTCDTLESIQSKNKNYTKDRNPHQKYNEKIIYANRGWGMNQENPPKNLLIEKTKSRHKQTSKESSEEKNVSSKLKVNCAKPKKGERLIEIGNQKIIAIKKKKSPASDIWMGDEDDGSEGEWVEEK